ncbi:hypothetical protein ACS0TY_013618 [Phlomoides rotata]
MYDSDSDSEMEEPVSRVDRLSELPNSLIHLILSFLPMRDVVKTTLLSKRWKNLWTTIPCLNFCDLIREGEEDETEKVRSFVNRALIFWRGIEILKFKIDIDWIFDSSLSGDIDLWVRFAVENKVEGLGIHLMYEDGEMDCPQLEVFELRLVESYENLNIRSTSLKKLKIEKYLVYGDDETSKDKVLRIRCPKLEILGLSGVLYHKYLFTNVSSLTDVTLGFNGSHDYAFGNELLEETMEHIFTTFQHVDKVSLSYWCVQVLGALQTKYLLPSLPSVRFFPNIKMLVIEDQLEDSEEFDSSKYVEFETKLYDASKYLEFETKLSKSFMLQLKTVDITSCLRNTSTFRFVEFLLKDASMLEKLVIRVDRTSADWFTVAERFLCMPRSSPTAKVILKKC